MPCNPSRTPKRGSNKKQISLTKNQPLLKAIVLARNAPTSDSLGWKIEHLAQNVVDESTKVGCMIILFLIFHTLLHSSLCVLYSSFYYSFVILTL